MDICPAFCFRIVPPVLPPRVRPPSIRLRDQDLVKTINARFGVVDGQRVGPHVVLHFGAATPPQPAASAA